MMFAVFAVTYVFSSRFSEVRGRAVSVLIIVAVIVLVANVLAVDGTVCPVCIGVAAWGLLRSRFDCR